MFHGDCNRILDRVSGILTLGHPFVVAFLIEGVLALLPRLLFAPLLLFLALLASIAHAGPFPTIVEARLGFREKAGNSMRTVHTSRPGGSTPRFPQPVFCPECPTRARIIEAALGLFVRSFGSLAADS